MRVPSSAIRSVGSKKGQAILGLEGLPPELQEAVHGNNRKKERLDSVTIGILRDRVRHRKRAGDVTPDEVVVRNLQKLGLGSKRKRQHVYEKLSEKQQVQFAMDSGTSVVSNKNALRTTTAAGGFAKHLASVSSDWPIFDHILPEIAFAGHSNSGKSTLVNAMAGCKPSSGPAGVSDRAGWTDQICFYQLGKKPPVFTLADLPGYGHAVARPQEIKQWKLMTRDYLKNRKVLGLCCIMVDCTRGLCSLDKSLVRFLHAVGLPWQIVLTKADLISTYELAQTLQVVETDLTYVIGRAGRPAPKRALLPVLPVSASTGAGVKHLYQSLEKRSISHTVKEGGAPNDLPSHAVREHRDAFLVRRRQAIDRLRQNASRKR